MAFRITVLLLCIVAVSAGAGMQALPAPAADPLLQAGL